MQALLYDSSSSYCISRLRVGLGTLVAVDAQASTERIAQRGIAAAFDAVAMVEQLMHPTRPGSDLAALRDCPRGVPLPVHPWTWEVLEICRHLNRVSHGIFDPCLPESAARITDLELRQPRTPARLPQIFAVVRRPPQHLDWPFRRV